MALDLMSRLAEAYGWSKNDLTSFSGGELLQIVRRLVKNEKERPKEICPMMRLLAGRK